MQKLSNPWLGHWALAVWAIANIYAHWNSWSWDASALYFAAYFYDLGQFGLVYSPDPAFFWGKTPPPEWVELARSQGQVGVDLSPFVYPPLWAAMLAPLASGMTALQFFNVFYVLNTAAIVGSVYLAYGFLKPEKLAFSIWCFITILMLQFSSVGQLALELNQPQVIVTFLIIAAFRLLLWNRDISAGAILALAAAIKIAPGILAIIFIMERRWKALAVFATIGAALLAASLLIAGPELHQAMIVRLRDLDAQVLISRIAVTMDAVLVQISNWWTGNEGWAFTHYWLQPEPTWVSWVTKAVLFGGVALTYSLTIGLIRGLRIWFRLLLVFLFALITAPLAWVHYLILPLLMLPGLVGLAPVTFVAPFLLGFTVAYSSILYVVFYVLSWGGNGQVFLNFATTSFTIAALLFIARRQQKLRSSVKGS